MSKPRAIEWLESETGEEIPYSPERAPARHRHLSVRVSEEVATELERMANDGDTSVSQLVRDLVTQAIERRRAEADLDTSALVDQLNAGVAELSRRLVHGEHR